MTDHLLLPDTPANTTALVEHLLNISRKEVAREMMMAVVGTHEPSAGDLEDFTVEIQSNNEYHSRVERKTMERIAALGDKADSALQVMASIMAKTGFWNYDPERPASLREHLESVLQGHKHSASTVSDLVNLVEVIIPALENAGLGELARNVIWRSGGDDGKGTIGKTRAFVNVVRKELEANPDLLSTTEGQLKYRQLLSDIGNDQVTLQAFVEKNRGVSTLSGWVYGEADATYFVIKTSNARDERFVRSSVGGRIEWSAGTGAEEFLCRLAKSGHPLRGKRTGRPGRSGGSAKKPAKRAGAGSRKRP